MLHVCSIHSAEKGKKGQVGESRAGETLGAAAAAFRNLTFPFCRLRPARPSLGPSLTLPRPSFSLPLFSLEPFRSNTHDFSENRKPVPYLFLPSSRSSTHRPWNFSRRDDNRDANESSDRSELIGSFNYFPKSRLFEFLMVTI